MERKMMRTRGGGGGVRGMHGNAGGLDGVMNTQYGVQVMCCAPEACLILLTSVTSINPIKRGKKMTM